MQCLLKTILLLTASVAAFGQRAYPSLGSPLSQDEIKNFDMMVGPEGKELPPDRKSTRLNSSH